MATHLCCPRDAERARAHFALLQRVRGELHGLLAAARSDGPAAPLVLHAASGGPAATLPETQGDMVRPWLVRDAACPISTG